MNKKSGSIVDILTLVSRQGGYQQAKDHDLYSSNHEKLIDGEYLKESIQKFESNVTKMTENIKKIGVMSKEHEFELPDGTEDYLRHIMGLFGKLDSIQMELSKIKGALDPKDPNKLDADYLQSLYNALSSDETLAMLEDIKNIADNYPSYLAPYLQYVQLSICFFALNIRLFFCSNDDNDLDRQKIKKQILVIDNLLEHNVKDCSQLVEKKLHLQEFQKMIEHNIKIDESNDTIDEIISMINEHQSLEQGESLEDNVSSIIESQVGKLQPLKIADIMAIMRPTDNIIFRVNLDFMRKIMNSDTTQHLLQSVELRQSLNGLFLQGSSFEDMSNSQKSIENKFNNTTDEVVSSSQYPDDEYDDDISHTFEYFSEAFEAYGDISKLLIPITLALGVASLVMQVNESDTLDLNKAIENENPSLFQDRISNSEGDELYVNIASFVIVGLAAVAGVNFPPPGIGY